MAIIHVSRSGAMLGQFDEARVREGLSTGEFIGTDLGWTEGMATWRPLSELESFRAPAPAPVTPPTPEPAPTPTASAQPMATLGPSETAPTTEASGLPWENRERLGFLQALLDTVVMVLTRPTEAFAVMRREGGFADPLLFLLIMGMAGAIVSFGYNSVLNSVGMMGGGSADARWASLLGAGVGSFFVLILMPVFILVGVFIGAAIAHVILMILGGANRPFETTLRVLCYSGGTTNVFQLVPFCGGLVAYVASIVLNCIGLARAHETDTWRAVLAVLLPLILCCGGGVLLLILIFGAAAGASGWQ